MASTHATKAAGKSGRDRDNASGRAVRRAHLRPRASGHRGTARHQIEQRTPGCRCRLGRGTLIGEELRPRHRRAAARRGAATPDPAAPKSHSTTAVSRMTLWAFRSRCTKPAACTPRGPRDLRAQCQRFVRAERSAFLDDLSKRSASEFHPQAELAVRTVRPRIVTTFGWRTRASRRLATDRGVEQGGPASGISLARLLCRCESWVDDAEPPRPTSSSSVRCRHVDGVPVIDVPSSRRWHSHG